MKEEFFQNLVNKQIFSKVNFFKDNQSQSYKRVIRGLHFQNPPYIQANLVIVVKVIVLDVVVGLRKESKTYGKYIIEKLN